jgi:steroid 5-alpha reductase family enzyme
MEMIMAILNIYLLNSALILGLLTLLWVVSLILRNSSIVDIFWGTGFVISTWVYFFLTASDFEPRKLLISTLVTIWGLRLSLYVLWRNAGKGEDYRYAKWRQETGRSWWWKSFFRVFLLQGVLLCIIVIPLLAAQLSSTQQFLTPLDLLASLVWLIGFFFEAVGDIQLARFKSNTNNKGKVLTTGLWRYTRHPNYFGDAAQWWGYYLFAVANGGGWSIFSPLLMTFFLLKVSGVSLLEKTLTNTKPEYREYIQKTSPFLPWFPKK